MPMAWNISRICQATYGFKQVSAYYLQRRMSVKVEIATADGYFWPVEVRSWIPDS